MGIKHHFMLISMLIAVFIIQPSWVVVIGNLNRRAIKTAGAEVRMGTNDPSKSLNLSIAPDNLHGQKTRLIKIQFTRIVLNA